MQSRNCSGNFGRGKFSDTFFTIYLQDTFYAGVFSSLNPFSPVTCMPVTFVISELARFRDHLKDSLVHVFCRNHTQSWTVWPLLIMMRLFSRASIQPCWAICCHCISMFTIVLPCIGWVHCILDYRSDMFNIFGIQYIKWNMNFW